MGVLTIMRLGVFIAALFTLICALIWIFIYCPSISSPNQVVLASSDLHGHVDIEDYFNKYEGQLNKELNILQRKNPVIFKKPQKENRPISPKLTEVTLPLDKFTDDVFESIISQLHKPEVDGFEKMISANNVTIYRRPKENGLFEYKLYADLPKAAPDMIMKSFLNNKYRLEWDHYITELFYVQNNDVGPDVLYFNVDYPWPLANRDYIYGREQREIQRDGKNYYTIVMHSALQHNIPEKKGVIRVNNYHQMLAMERTPWGGSYAYIYYSDDPKGSIPSWLVNWAAKTGVPGFLNDIQRACKGYAAFEKRQEAN